MGERPPTKRNPEGLAAYLELISLLFGDKLNSEKLEFGLWYLQSENKLFPCSDYH